MFNVTNVETLGADYDVTDSSGKLIKTIQIIPQDEILEATFGAYKHESDSLAEYIEKSIATLTGFESVDPTKILWYATPNDEVILADLIEYAVKEGYDKIILEKLNPLDE